MNLSQPRLQRAAKFLFASIIFVGTTTLSVEASAQVLGGETNPLMLVVMLALLALLPFVLVMVTSFVKIAVVLSLLRTAIGVQQVPPNQVITGLAIILSIYVMAPVGTDIYAEVRPFVEEAEKGKVYTLSDYEKLGKKALQPLKTFLVKHTDEQERGLLYELAFELRTPEQRAELSDMDALVLVPAFILTELKEAFIIGFILFVPFIVVDLVIANILLSLGMHMLSPTTVSLPFKLLLFVLVDGWFLVIKGLILGYV